MNPQPHASLKYKVPALIGLGAKDSGSSEGFPMPCMRGKLAWGVRV